MNHSAKNRAFTLVEVMITMAIFTLILEAVYGTVIISQRSWNTYAQTTAPKQNLRATMAALVKELRGSSGLSLVKKTGDVELNFRHPSYGNVKYTWTDAGEDANKILRINNSHKTVLAYNITDLAFVLPFSNDQVTIEIGSKIANGTTLQLKEKVALRMQTFLF